jgi:hypothetical protein
MKTRRIAKEFITHYRVVFQSQSLTNDKKVTMQVCLDTMSHQHESLCDQCLTLDELIVTLMEMVDDKSPCHEGFPCDFYKVT